MTMIGNISLALALVAGAGIALAEGGRTREQVKAELAEAQRTGDVIANGETGLKLNELSPGRYPMYARARKTGAQSATAQGEAPRAR
jgi:hypothetical protein